MSAFRRDGKWCAKFQMDGVLHWVPGGPWPTKTQAKNAEAHYRDKLRARRTSETCASFAERWVREWPRKAHGTRALYEQAAATFAAEFGPTPLGEVERLSARTWALSVPRNMARTVGTMYEDARNVGLVETNPFSNLRLPAKRTDEIVPPTLEEYRMLLRSCVLAGGYAAEMRAMVQFAAWTALRAGELHGLQWQDIGEDEIQVRRARKDDGTLGLPKNGKERPCPFLPPARVLDQVPRREGSPFVFHTPRGKPLNKSNGYYHWNKVRAPLNLQREEAGLVGVRWHDLRHACATWLLEMGMSHFDVSVQLGHEDNGQLVMARYGHPSRDAAKGRLLALFADGAVESGSATGSGA